MKKLLLGFILFSLVACSQQGTLVIETDDGQVKVMPELAITSKERRDGLMHRKSLGEDAGMLFIFPKDFTPSFWMKNTLIDLDMIFINNNFEIVDITHSALPCKTEKCPLYGTKKMVRYVLEVNGGFSKEQGIEIGDKVRYTLPKTVLDLK